MNKRPLHLATSSVMPAGGTAQDTERALRLIAVLAPGTGETRFCVIDGEPASKSRPRFTRSGKPYRTREDVDAEERTAWHIRRIFKQPWTGNVALGCVFFRPNRQRIDVDNMLKHVCDAANGVAWVDDSQVTAVYGIAELDAGAPRTIVVFGRHSSSLTRGTDNVAVCAYCGSEFVITTYRAKKHCSDGCRYKALGHDLSEPIPCKQCGTPFRRTTAKQVMCSKACVGDSVRGRNRSRGGPPSRCEDCNKELKHRRGGRCRECWRANPIKDRATALPPGDAPIDSHCHEVEDGLLCVARPGEVHDFAVQLDGIEGGRG